MGRNKAVMSTILDSTEMLNIVSETERRRHILDRLNQMCLMAPVMCADDSQFLEVFRMIDLRVREQILNVMESKKCPFSGKYLYENGVPVYYHPGVWDGVMSKFDYSCRYAEFLFDLGDRFVADAAIWYSEDGEVNEIHDN